METANNYILLIDYDHRNPYLMRHFEKRMFRTASNIQEIAYIKFDGFLRKRTFHGCHYYIKIYSPIKLEAKDLLFLQTILGDDRLRCIFNFNRLLLHWAWKNSNVFFRENEI